MTSKRMAQLGVVLSFLSTVPAVVACVLALHRPDPGTRGWAVTGIVSAALQALTLGYMVAWASAWSTEPMTAFEVARAVAYPLLLGWGSVAGLLAFQA